MPRISSTRLTDTAVANLKARDQRYEIYDALQPGFGIRVAPSGAKTWIVMGRVAGRKKRVSLGRYPAMTLKAARAGAQSVLRQMQSGVMEKPEPDLTFDAALAQWYDREQRSRRSFSQVERAMQLHVRPFLAGKPLDQISKRDLIQVIDRVTDSGAKVQANRVRAFCRRFFRWCTERDLLDASPAAALPKPAPEVSRDRVLSEKELRKIWQAAGKMGYPFGPVFQLLVLTGQRRDEVAKLRRSELDEANRVWSFQGARAKNHKAHVVHLSAQSLAVLAGVPRSSDQDLLFSTNGRTAVSGFSRAKARLDTLSGVSDWRLHDLRRSFATHAVERLKAQPAVVDKVLNHSAATIRGVQAVYQRAEFLAERESVLEAWGAFVEGLCTTNK